jgi:hypothetical protein
MLDDKYRPRSFTEDPGPDPISLINEPIAPDNVSAMPFAKGAFNSCCLGWELEPHESAARALGGGSNCAEGSVAGGGAAAVLCYAASGAGAGRCV